MEPWVVEAIANMVSALDVDTDKPTKGSLRVPQYVIDQYGIDAVQSEADELARMYGFPDGSDVVAYDPWA